MGQWTVGSRLRMPSSPNPEVTGPVLGELLVTGSIVRVVSL